MEKAAAENDINRKAIAKAIGRSPSQISTTLSGPSNWTLDTVSDLLRAVGAEMDYEVVFDKDRKKSNFYHPSANVPAQISLLPASASSANIIVENFELVRA